MSVYRSLTFIRINQYFHNFRLIIVFTVTKIQRHLFFTVMQNSVSIMTNNGVLYNFIYIMIMVDSVNEFDFKFTYILIYIYTNPQEWFVFLR